jgi:ABC-type antimicrobial peptide transport system permease subunit
LVTAVLGWLVGIPVGYALARLIMEVFERRFDVAFTFRFPLWPIPVALVITVVVTMLVLWLPLRRVARMSPGTALRYE